MIVLKYLESTITWFPFACGGRYQQVGAESGFAFDSARFMVTHNSMSSATSEDSPIHSQLRKFMTKKMSDVRSEK